MDRLLVNAKYQQSNYDPETDDIKLKALLYAAKLWFQSQTANIDVREIDTHLRAALYKVGSKADINDLDIWGKTFVIKLAVILSDSNDELENGALANASAFEPVTLHPFLVP